MSGISLIRTLLATLVAGAALLSACGDEDDEHAATGQEQAAAPAGLEPTEVESSVEGFLAKDEVASSLQATVDCGDEPAESIDCTISGAKGLSGVVTAVPSPGFAYTGEIEDEYGPNALGGSSADGSIYDPPSVEKGLNETDFLSENAGSPTADCPDAPEDESLVCEVTGDDVTGTLTATPIGGFEWEGQIETPDGTRAIAGNALPD